MTEDEETVCRLTYKEGKEIEKEARGPYEKESFSLLVMGLVCFVFSFGAMLVCQTFGLEDHEGLDELLANGDITQAFYDYEVKGIRAQFPLTGASLFFACMIGAIVMTSIGRIEGKRALKKANDEKEEALKMVREEEE